VTEPQLNLLGEPDQPEDDDLGPVQKAAMRVIRRAGSMSRDEAGAIAHANRGRHDADERCAFCGTDGAQLLESLIRRKLVEPAPGGMVQLPRAVRTAEPAELPPGHLSEFGF
jgi:hypothetical protein